MSPDIYRVVTKPKMSDAEVEIWLEEIFHSGWILVSVHDYQYIFINKDVK